jgi:hypothetical protein
MRTRSVVWNARPAYYLDPQMILQLLGALVVLLTLLNTYSLVTHGKIK